MNFVLMESFYQLDYGKPEIILWGRSISNPKKLETHVIKGFRPYFYAPYNEEPYHDRITEYHDEIIKDALDRPVRKVYTKIPSDVPKVRDLFSFTDMADFLFDKRFLVDNHIRYAYNYTGEKIKPIEKEDILVPRIVYFDIEVLSPQGVFPNPLDADYPIVSIQTLDNYTNTIMVFTNGVPQTDDPTHIALTTEHDLYQTFMDYLKRVNPDIITGWSSSSYDLPYIIRRSWKLHVDISNLARYGTPRCEYDPETGSFNLRIIGRSTLDMLEAFKKITSARAQRESYGLKSIISDEDLFGDEAFEYDDLGPIMQKIFDGERWTEFIDYCKNDVIALEIIDRRMGLFTFFENLRKLTGCKLDDVLYNSKIIEMLLMHEGLTVMPTKQKFIGSSDDETKFQGATVIEPKPGISEYMATFDLASLYPNIMIGFQKSPDKDGLVVKTLEKTLALREDLRRQCKEKPDDINLENQQNAVKYINNSYYGVMGLRSFRLYNREIAEFVTRTGRDLNQFLQDIAKSQGKDVIFGDSVCKDTTLKIYDNVGNWKYVKISELFTHVDFTKGDKEYCNLNCYVESIDANGKIILDHVPYIMRHKCNKQMYNLSITNEWSINVTEDHSVFCYVSKKVKPKLEQYKRLIEKSPTEIGKNGINSIITRRSSIHTNVSSLNKDTIFYEYLGYHIGNGSIHYGKNGNRSGYRLGISFGKDEDILKSYFLDYLETNKYIYNITKDNRNNGDYRFYGELTHFIEINIGHAHEKHIPEFMYHETVENIQAFIRGYMTADGTVMVRNGLPIIRLTSISYDLIQGMQKLLFQVGIACGYFSENNENTYNGKSSGTYSKHLVIYDVMRYRNTIGFITPRKQELLSKCNPFKVDDSIDWSYSNKVIISPIDYNDYVYDLHCEQTNRYFANNILVHNTDSIGVMPIETVEEGKRLETHLNDQLIEWSKSHNSKVNFKLKFEKLYRRILFKSDKKGSGVKKKYCGHIIWEEGRDKSNDRELNYKGLELKRSDQSEVTRDVLHYFLEKVLIDGNTKEALDYVKKIYNNIKSGNIDIYEISIPKAVRKVSYSTDNAWIRGIYTAKTEYNYIIQEGVKPRLIYLKRGEICIDEDFDTSQIKDKIDYKKMADKVIKQKMESYIWSINQNWDHVIHNQQSLDNW